MDRKAGVRIVLGIAYWVKETSKEGSGRVLPRSSNLYRKGCVAKRLAIAMLLVRGLGYEEIKEILKVNDPTITRVQNQLRSGSGFLHLAQRLANREFWREFVEDFEKLTAMYPRRKKRYPKFPFNI